MYISSGSYCIPINLILDNNTQTDKYDAIIKSSHHNIQTNMLPSSSHNTRIFKISQHSHFSLNSQHHCEVRKNNTGQVLNIYSNLYKMGRFWNMLATAVLGGAKTEINQVLWASKLQTNISIKLLI